MVASVREAGCGENRARAGQAALRGATAGPQLRRGGALTCCCSPNDERHLSVVIGVVAAVLPELADGQLLAILPGEGASAGVWLDPAHLQGASRAKERRRRYSQSKGGTTWRRVPKGPLHAVEASRSAPRARDRGRPLNCAEAVGRRARGRRALPPRSARALTCAQLLRRGPPYLPKSKHGLCRALQGL